MNGVGWLREHPALAVGDVVDPEQPKYHDPVKLAKRLIRLYYDRAESRPILHVD